MIHAAISIRVKGQIYRYVRDVLVASPGGITGVPKQYYAYRGNARRKINLTRNNITHSLHSGLKPKQNYEFKVNVNTSGLETFNVSFWPRDELQPITYFDVINKLNSVSDKFRVEFIDANREEEGIYFIAEGNQADTSILVSAGDTNDLFSSLEHFNSIEDELVSDNFFDQNAVPGQIANDLDSILTDLADGTNSILSFPDVENGSQLLVRESNEIKNGLVINHIVKSSVDGINVTEIVKNVR